MLEKLQDVENRYQEISHKLTDRSYSMLPAP